MKKKKRIETEQHCASRSNPDTRSDVFQSSLKSRLCSSPSGIAAHSSRATVDEEADFEALVSRLRSAQRQIDEVASRIPPLSAQQIHTLVESGRRPQFQIRQQADRYLLAYSLLLLLLAAGLLWYTAPIHITPFSIAVLIFSAIDLWVISRAACSLWLMRQTLRLRFTPLRMARYSDHLNRLSHRRRYWLNFVLRNSSPSASSKEHRQMEFFCFRLPSYTIALGLLLLLALNTSKTFANTHDFIKIITTTDKTDTTLFLSASRAINQLSI